MALSGLPKSGRIGFELFDRTNLGVTDFAEHINYQRALEGELERSVMSLTEVEQARVHITLAKDSVFTQSREPAKASVLLKLRPGVTLAPRSVVAISHLVAAAVEGLTPPGRVRGRYERQPAEPAPRATGWPTRRRSSDSFIEYQQSLEKSLVDKINETLEPLLGPGRFRAGVSVECDFTHSEQNEELFNPEQSVVTSSHVTEESTGGPGGAGGSAARGIPGTASALPRPRPETGPAGNGVSRRSENTTYQASRTVRHTTTPQGKVKKISAAVLVDYVLASEGEGDKQTRKLLARAARKDGRHSRAGVGRDRTRPQARRPAHRADHAVRDDAAVAESGPPANGSGRGSLRSQKILDRLQHEPMLMVAAGAAVLLLLGAAAWMLRRLRKKPAATLQKGHARAGRGFG